MAGRKQKPYQTSWRETIPGLTRQVDGRWRIIATGERFTESDEVKAVARFRAITGQSKIMDFPFAMANLNDKSALKQAFDLTRSLPTLEPVVNGSGKDEIEFHIGDGPTIVAKIREDGTHEFYRQPVQEAAFWNVVKERFFHDPADFGRMIGVPGLANYAQLGVASPSLKINDVIENYKTHNGSTPKAKQEATKPLQRLATHIGARTLDELTTEEMLAYKSHIESAVAGPATRRAYYARIKAVIGFGLKTGLDATQIRACLDRAKVLWTAEAMPNVNPRPITQFEFKALLQHGGNAWRPWLLAGLNLCLHMEEVCALKWDSLDLDGATYCSIRNKTRRQRIPRAATLWHETIAALRQVKRTASPYVFVSSHGTRYNRNTRINDFREMRIKAQLPDVVTFDTIRDGAFTVAAKSTHDERLARILAGHRAAGYQDNYVLRNPEIVRPACEAVYQTYGPF